MAAHTTKEPISRGDLWTHKHNLSLISVDIKVFSTALLTGYHHQRSGMSIHIKRIFVLHMLFGQPHLDLKNWKHTRLLLTCHVGIPNLPSFFFSSMIFNILGVHSTTACPVGEQGIPMMWKTPHCCKTCQVHSEVWAGPLYILTVSRRPEVAKQVSQCRVTSWAFSVVQAAAIKK